MQLITVKERWRPVIDYLRISTFLGLTSTTMEPITINKSAVLEEDIVKYRRVTKNGYVRIITNHGPLNLELLCKGRHFRF